MDSQGCPCRAFCFAVPCADEAEVDERILGVDGGKHLRKLTRYRVLSKNSSAGFSATADLVSVCSLAFLDGPTGLRLTFTVTLPRKKEIKMGGEVVITDIPMQWVTREKGTVQIYSGYGMCSLIQGS